MTVTRSGVTKPLFTSSAHYWEPAGAVSWDVAMTVPKSTWRVKLKAGDVLFIPANEKHRLINKDALFLEFFTNPPVVSYRE